MSTNTLRSARYRVRRALQANADPRVVRRLRLALLRASWRRWRERNAT